MDQIPNQQPAQPPKGHMKPFWPLMIIFVVAVSAIGLIYWFQFNLSLDYDLQSVNFTAHWRNTRTPKPMAEPGKMPIKGATSTPSQLPTGK